MTTWANFVSIVGYLKTGNEDFFKNPDGSTWTDSAVLNDNLSESKYQMKQDLLIEWDISETDFDTKFESLTDETFAMERLQRSLAHLQVWSYLELSGKIANVESWEYPRMIYYSKLYKTDKSQYSKLDLKEVNGIAYSHLRLG